MFKNTLEQSNQPNKNEVRIDDDYVVNRIVNNNPTWSEERKAELHKYYRVLLEQYQKIEINLPIEDEPMKRICQILTNADLITEDSCDGHGERLPKIFFTCKNELRLRQVAHILARSSNYKNFPWVVELFSADPDFNPHQPLKYTLTPSQSKGIINPIKQREELLRDLDILGMRLLEYFFVENQEDAE